MKVDYKAEQARYRELNKPKLHPKGTKVTHTKHHGRKFKDEERQLPNASGSHMVQVGGKFVFVSRKSARQRVVDSKLTRKGYTFGIKTNGREYRAIHRIAERQGKDAKV